MIISIDAEKSLDKVHYSFMIKILHKVGVQEPHLNIVKATYKKPTYKTILYGQKLLKKHSC